MSKNHFVPDILAVTRHVVEVQHMVNSLPLPTLDAVLGALKHKVDSAPDGADNDKHVLMIKLFEAYKKYALEVKKEISEAAKDGMFTDGDAEQYKHILTGLADPGTDTKQ